MNKYKTVTTITDYGPYITKLILPLPAETCSEAVDADTFHVFLKRVDRKTGETIVPDHFWQPDAVSYPSQGYRKIERAYTCDAEGNYKNPGSYVALEFGEDSLGRRIEGKMMSADYVDCQYRITQLKTINEAPPISGLVYDEWDKDICPQLSGWANGQCTDGEFPLGYGYYTPEAEGKLPLVIWLHGAGEGGTDPTVAYTGNKVVALSSPQVQKKLGGAAWVLAPQCPTVWMDDGKERLGHSNRSIYVKSLKACIDAFVAEHEDGIDRERILIGGCSNGGFMTMRMIFDYPDFFAAAYPVCEVFFSENITEDMLKRILHLPIWFVHSKGDELVDPVSTSIATYHRLTEAGAENVHMTYFNGVFREDEHGRRVPGFNHGVWVYVYNDECVTDFDGRNVLCGGMPVSIWEWLGKQHR